MIPTKIQGFTLIEMVMVIVIAAILATVTTRVIVMPVKAYTDVNRRTALIDKAEFALRRMQRDIRRALPNSIRITGGGTVLELLHAIDGGRYRAGVDPGASPTGGVCAANPAGDVLDFTLADTCFQVLGTLTTFNPQATAGEFLVIYNLGSASADTYAGNNRTVVSNASNAQTVKFNAYKFPYSSPQQRFFIVDTPITYKCVNNQMLRYAGYAMTAVQANPPAGTGQLQADDIASCSFAYDAGTPTRAALVTLVIKLTDIEGESVQLMQQVHVDNLS